jgi:hypothetical protein
MLSLFLVNLTKHFFLDIVTLTLGEPLPGIHKISGLAGQI